MFTPVLCASTVAIVACYYLWRKHTDREWQQRTLKQRVAYLLWCTANGPQDSCGNLRKV
jgi:hypothetical protein